MRLRLRLRIRLRLRLVFRVRVKAKPYACMGLVHRRVQYTMHRVCSTQCIGWVVHHPWQYTMRCSTPYMGCAVHVGAWVGG